jgi:hypothetical protein
VSKKACWLGETGEARAGLKHWCHRRRGHCKPARYFDFESMGIFLEFIFLSIPAFQFVPDYQMPLTDAVKLMAIFLSFLKKKPLHSTEGGKGFLVFDLLVLRLIAVVLTLTSTKQF